MAKSIEQTPVLKGEDRVRFMNILSNVDRVTLETHEREVQEMVKTIPKKLKP